LGHFESASKERIEAWPVEKVLVQIAIKVIN